MKKTVKFILVTQTIVIALFWIYGYVQGIETERQTVLAEQVRESAEQQINQSKKEIESLQQQLENCKKVNE